MKLVSKVKIRPQINRNTSAILPLVSLHFSLQNQNNGRRHILNLCSSRGLVFIEQYDWLFGVFFTSRVEFESHKEEINMAAGCVYWLAEDKLNEISKALELFKNHDGWKGEIVYLLIKGNVQRDSVRIK